MTGKSDFKTKNELIKTLERIDGKGYKAYKDIQGAYDCGDHYLYVDHVQGDPFAAPSRVSVFVPQAQAGFPEWTYGQPARAVGVANLLARKFADKAKSLAQDRGSGASGRIEMDRPGQEVMPITAVRLTKQGVEARFTVGLPARGRKVLGRQARKLLVEDVADLAGACLYFSSLKAQEVQDCAFVNEDADALREQLRDLGLVAFVADGAILPRRSGIDDRPLHAETAVAFRSPPTLQVKIDLPNAGSVTGMGIREGVTLVVGGGYHGKSTLLNAVEKGVYNHLPGDGREFVVAREDAVKIRAEDGRSVSGVDISPFIGELPYGRSTQDFSSTNASGSTSQAANIMEALEAGTSLFMLDEDTSATNFMIRDHRMQKLVAKENEPITPFIDKVRQLYDEEGVSTIVVIGGSGDYFDIADRVVAMREYVPEDVTEQAVQVAREVKTGRTSEAARSFGRIASRKPDPQSLPLESRGRRIKVKTRSRYHIQLGWDDLELRALEQLVDSSQTRALAEAIIYAREKYWDGQMSLGEMVETVDKDIRSQGLDVLARQKLGSLAYFRPQELAAAVNRLRKLSII